MIAKCDLFQIRKDIEASVGSKVQLRSNRGRRKAFIKEGVLENAYPSIFVIKFENSFEATRRVSYSYTDLLTKAVEISFQRDNVTAQVS